MLFPEAIIGVVAECAHWADRLVRADLMQGYIATENDYTSNFTGALRREINSRSIPGLAASAYVLRPTVEREYGADACIILSTRREMKLGVFEAKWPRFSVRTDGWDALQKASKRSHFHEQLTRQRMLVPQIATWGMFYLEHPYGRQPIGAPTFGSACIWHQDLFSLSNARVNTSPWTDAELLALISSKCQSIDEVVRSICECRAGLPIPASDFMAPLSDYGTPAHAIVIQYDEDSARRSSVTLESE